MVVIEVNYEYEGLGWDEVNSFCDKAKRDCLMDPDSVQVVVDERPDGSTAFLFSGKAPTWTRMFMPDVCQWVDVVKYDSDKQIRTEIGRNITKKEDGVKLNEDTTWKYDPVRKSTMFHRRLELEVPGIPSYFMNKCVGFYDANVMRVRKEEAEAIRKQCGSQVAPSMTSSQHTSQPMEKKLDYIKIINHMIRLTMVLACSLFAMRLFDFILSHFDIQLA